MTYERLDDILDLYPGGAVALARDAKLSPTRVWAVVRADHATKPVKHLLAIESALRRRKIRGPALTELWGEAKRRRLQSLAAKAEVRR